MKIFKKFCECLKINSTFQEEFAIFGTPNLWNFFVKYYKTFIQKLEEKRKKIIPYHIRHMLPPCSVLHVYLLVLVPYFAICSSPFDWIREFTPVSWTFSQWFWSFLEVFLIITLIFFQNFNKYYSKLILFLIFTAFSRQFLSSLLTFYKFFATSSNFIFKDLLGVSIKLQLKFVQIFILVYLKFFLQVSEVFLNFFWPSNYFSQIINCQ